MRRQTVPAIALLLALGACGGTETISAPHNRTYPDIGGNYAITGSVAGPLGPLETFTGSLALTQAGDTPSIGGSASLSIMFGDGSSEFVSTAITGSVTPTGEVQFTVPVSNAQTTWSFVGQYATSQITGTHSLMNASIGQTFAGPFTATRQ